MCPRQPHSRLSALPGLVLWLSQLALSCTVTAPSAIEVASLGQAVINGDDDRVDFFEVQDALQRSIVTESAVVLMDRARLDQLSPLPTKRAEDAAPTHCPVARFSEQPHVAFCSGVLVDADLVLTAGHCLRSVPSDEVAIVFGYYFQEPDQLAIGPDDVFQIAEILTTSYGDLDYAWLRLSTAPLLPHKPAAIRPRSLPLANDEPVFAVTSTNGIPLKVDAGGGVFDARTAQDDYFIAGTDTFQGSSGGGAFDAQGRLLGVAAHGSADFLSAADGCLETVQRTLEQGPQESFTYAHRARDALCKSGASSELCATRPDGVGCSAVSIGRSAGRAGCLWLLLMAAVGWRFRRRAA